jgi:signal transduction histidine kinase
LTIMNLVTNAAEAARESGSTIRVRTRGLQLTAPDLVSWRIGVPPRPGNYVMLEVSDDGSGMDERTAARMFDPFYTTKFIGRGLGLAAVLGIVRAHEGAINVVSAPGAGTTFRVVLPAVEHGVEVPVC